MKQIIEGKRYNTETAIRVCDCSPRGFHSGDFQWEDTDLYRTPKGNWFLAGKGGPMSRWAERSGQTGRTSGAGICPLTEDEARAMLEKYGVASDVEEFFGSVVEDA